MIQQCMNQLACTRFFPRSCLPVACCFPHCLLILFWPSFSVTPPSLPPSAGAYPIVFCLKKQCMHQILELMCLVENQSPSTPNFHDGQIGLVPNCGISSDLARFLSTFWQSMGDNTAYQSLLMQSSNAFLYGNVGPSFTSQIWFTHALCIVWFATILLFSRKKWQLNGRFVEISRFTFYLQFSQY